MTAGISYWDAALPGLLVFAFSAVVLPWAKVNNPIMRVCALAVCIFLAWRYILWRIFETIPPLDTPVDFAIGTLFTTVEFLSILGSTASMIFMMRVKNRTAEVDANLSWLLGLKKAPKVDVLICTYNEGEDILERTIAGALAMNYDNYRVWVCDDGRRDWLRDLCAEYGVGYLVRSDNKHAKAGNINAALKHLKTLSEKPDFISILDADFVPLPDFLTRATALTRDDDVGVVQTPQHFFNPDPVQSNLELSRAWPDEQRFFFDIVMASKDAWGAAFCCGTSSVIRFDALMSIDGFPTDSVTEDYLVSLRLRQKGFRTVYLNEPLSLGLAPEGLAEYSGQRSRWCLGFVQICRGPSGPLKLNNQLPWVDRIMLCETFLHWSATHLFRLLGIIVPTLYLLFDIHAVHATVVDAILHLLPFFVAQVVVFHWLTRGRVMPILADVYQLLCANEVLKAVIAGLIRPNGQKFKVTAKGGARSKIFIQWPMMRVFLGYLAFAISGIVFAFLFNPSRSLADASAIALFWSWYNIIILLLACYVCIEQPRMRNSERFNTDDLVQISASDSLQMFRAIDISATGIQLAGAPPGPIGTMVRIRFGEIDTQARIQRLTPLGFAMQFELTVSNRDQLIRHVFSGKYSAAIEKIKASNVALAIGARLFK